MGIIPHYADVAVVAGFMGRLKKLLFMRTSHNFSHIGHKPSRRGFLRKENTKRERINKKERRFDKPFAHLCVLSGVYWFYWRPRLIAEKESSAMAKEKLQEKVREMEEAKSAIFSGKKESEENPQDEVYLYLEDFEGNPTRVPQSNAKEFLAEMEKARERAMSSEGPRPSFSFDSVSDSGFIDRE